MSAYMNPKMIIAKACIVLHHVLPLFATKLNLVAGRHDHAFLETTNKTTKHTDGGPLYHRTEQEAFLTDDERSYLETQSKSTTILR